LALENQRLREEIDRLKHHMSSAVRRGSVDEQAALVGSRLRELESSAAGEKGRVQLLNEFAALRQENERLKSKLAAMGSDVGSPSEGRGGGEKGTHVAGSLSGAVVAGGGVDKAGGGGGAESLRKQLKDFTINTQMDLERQVQHCQARAVMAEEQLEQLQKYIAQASVAYQREIMRLRQVVQRLEPSGAALSRMGDTPGGLSGG
jgi:hypothetical protein